MADLNQIFEVDITLSGGGIQGASFDTALVVGSSNRMSPDIVREYDDFTAVEADFQDTDPEFIAAEKYFGQQQSPSKLYIGARTTPVAQVMSIAVGIVADSTAYTVVYNGVSYTYTSGVGASAATIAAGLLAVLLAASIPNVLFASGPSNTVTATSTAAGLGFALSAFDAHLVVTQTTANNGVVDDIKAIQAVNNKWFMVHLTSRDKNEILELAAYIETQPKMFIACSQDSAVTAGTAGNVLLQLKAKGYLNTAYLWSGDQASYPEAAWSGLDLPYDPGSETWALKQISGIAADVLTATQSSHVLDNFGNTYEPFSNKSLFRNGQVASGEYIDVIRFKYWLQNQMQVESIDAIIQVPKQPYTDQGAGVIENVMRKVLEEGVAVGGLVAGGYSIGVIKAANQTSSNRSARFFAGFTFVAELAGAIQKGQIKGTLTF